ncbi:MAG: hypothetical protein JWM20_540 [Patescibacteria group bacterium]|nr:hypothetical protein [Patescibacteria group bacterium]
MNKKTLPQFHKGFTLIETLFAILIFSAALIALMTIAGRGISATANAAQTTTASYIAQEGIEVARNMRDSNYESGGVWDSNLSSCAFSTPCKVVYGTGSTAPMLAPCSSYLPSLAGTAPTCGEVVKASASGGFADTGTNSQYSRTVYVVPVTPVPTTQNPTPSVNEYEVISRVNWVSKTIPHVVTLETIVKDWH